MDKKNNNAMVPRLRFPGFTDAWEQRKISQLANLNYGGGTPPTIKEEYWHGVIPWIQSSDITKDDVLNVSPKKFISQDAVNHSATKIVPANSIAVITRVGVGKLAFMPFSYTTSQDFLSLSKLNVDGHFAVYSLYRKLQNDLNIVQGTSIKGITKGELLAKEIAIPEIREQNQIGAFFKDLNNLITLHQRKLNHLKDRKKALLQQLFPKNGESVPQLRFPEFNDAWEQRKVTELANIFIGLVTTMTKNYTTEGTLLIRNSDIKDNRFEFGKNPIYLESSFAEKNSTRMHLLGDVITVHTGDVGTSAVITENEVNSIGFATIVSRPNPKIIDSKYFASFLNTDMHKKWAVSISTGDGRTNYNLGDYKKLIVPLPELDEQKKIAQFIDYLSNLITLHQRKLNHLKDRKKALLQQLFI